MTGTTKKLGGAPKIGKSWLVLDRSKRISGAATLYCTGRDIILISTRGEWHIPDNIVKKSARCLLHDIVVYCESEEGKAAFEKWKTEEALKTKQKSKAA